MAFFDSIKAAQPPAPYQQSEDALTPRPRATQPSNAALHSAIRRDELRESDVGRRNGKLASCNSALRRCACHIPVSQPNGIAG